MPIREAFLYTDFDASLESAEDRADYRCPRLSRRFKNLFRELPEEERDPYGYVCYLGIEGDMESEMREPCPVCGRTESEENVFTGQSWQDVLKERINSDRESVDPDMLDVKLSSQRLCKRYENAMRNEMSGFLQELNYTEIKDCIAETYKHEIREMLQSEHTELKQSMERIWETVHDWMCGSSGGRTDVSGHVDQIRVAIKSISETYNRQKLKANLLNRSRNVRKTDKRTESQNRMSERLFMPRIETPGTVDRHRNSIALHRESACRKMDARKICIYDVPDKSRLIHHKTSPSVFLPKRQTLGENKHISVMFAA
jgi:hypothetical protein